MQINSIEESRVAQAVHAHAPARHGSPLTLRGVRKAYGEREVLAGVDLALQPGEFVALVGRSGCGKSTLLRTIAGLEQPDAGSVDTARARQRMMFQEPRLLPWKRVVDNVALGLGGASGARQALEAVGLAARGRDWPAQLSGGQRQRVALARALVHAPDLLLLDEPFGALDALTRIEMQALVDDLWRQRGFTALLVTHDVQEAVALADRVLLIEDGGIAEDIAVDLPRPRRRGSPAFAALEDHILQRLMGAHACGAHQCAPAH